MDITFLGHSSFKIKGKEASIITDPYDPQAVGLKFPKVSADIVTVSHNHNDHNAISMVSDVKRVFDGPGEYEMLGVSILGFASYHDSKKGEERGKNTINVIEIEKVRVVHLGDLGHKISEKLMETIGEIDVLMIPVGGFYTIGPDEASEIVKATEPKIIIPMHYQMEGLNSEIFKNLVNIDEFVSKLDYPVEKIDKLSFSKQSIEEKTKIVVLSKKD